MNVHSLGGALMMLGWLLTTAAGSQAQTLAVANFSFENPDLADGVSQEGIPGWTGQTAHGTPVFQVSDPTHLQFPGADGNNSSLPGSASAGQAALVGGVSSEGTITTSAPIATVEAGVTYVLRVAFGDALDASLEGGTVKILVDGQQVAFGSLHRSSADKGRFVDAQAHYTAITSGGLLTVEVNVSGTGYVDNVRLDRFQMGTYVIADEFRPSADDLYTYEAVSMNDQRFIIGSRRSQTLGLGDLFVYRAGRMVFLPRPYGLRDGYYPGVVEISDVGADGTFFVVGVGSFADGKRRPLVWRVREELDAHAVTGSWVLQNRILPADSAAPGEQPSSFPYGINSAGTVAGNGDSYLVSVPLVWHYPYSEPPHTPAAPASGEAWDDVQGLDEQGRIFQSDYRYNAPSPLMVDGVHLPGTAEESWAAVGLEGGWAIGWTNRNRDGRNVVDGFRWRIGMAELDILPEFRPVSVSAFGDVIDEDNQLLLTFGATETRSFQLRSLMPSWLYVPGEPLKITTDKAVLLESSDAFTVIAPAGTGGSAAPHIAPREPLTVQAGARFSVPIETLGDPFLVKASLVAGQFGYSLGTLNAGSTSISGTAPEVPGEFHIFAYAANAGGVSAVQDFVLRVPPHIAVDTSTRLNEGATGTQEIPVFVVGGSGAEVSVDYRFVSGSAALGTDFLSASGTVQLKPEFDPVWGTVAARGKIVVPVIEDDETEDNETLTLLLSNPVGEALLPRDTWTVIISANDGGSGWNTVLTPPQEWEASHFHSSSWLAAANGSDPDGDNMINLLEKAFGSDPHNAGSADGPTAHRSEDGNFVTFSYRRLKGGSGTASDCVAYGIRYQVQASPGLGEWLPLTEVITPSSTVEANDDGTTETVTLNVPATSDAPEKLFLKVRVTQE